MQQPACTGVLDGALLRKYSGQVLRQSTRASTTPTSTCPSCTHSERKRWWGFCWHARHLTHDGGLLRYMSTHPLTPSIPILPHPYKDFCLPLSPTRIIIIYIYHTRTVKLFNFCFNYHPSTFVYSLQLHSTDYSLITLTLTYHPLHTPISDLAARLATLSIPHQPATTLSSLHSHR